MNSRLWPPAAGTSSVRLMAFRPHASLLSRQVEARAPFAVSSTVELQELNDLF